MVKKLMELKFVIRKFFFFEKSIRTSTYNFNDESKWIEFIITLYKPLTKNKLTIISSYLNVQIYELQKKRMESFF